MDITTIRVNKIIKERLEKLRTNESYGDLLERMVAYFERTGINPSSSYIPPDEVVKKQISRVIEVIRGVEKSQLVYFKNLTDLLIDIGARREANLLPKDLVIQEDDPNSLSLEELQEFMKQYEDLKKNNQELKAEISKLRVASDEGNKGNSFEDRNFSSIKSVLNAIEKMPFDFVNDQLLIKDAAAFHSALNRIREELCL